MRNNYNDKVMLNQQNSNLKSLFSEMDKKEKDRKKSKIKD